MMNGKAWEMKSPQGKSRTTVEHAFKRTAKQSENIIIDLRRTRIPANQIRASLEKLFKTSRRIKNLKIITAERQVIDFKSKRDIISVLRATFCRRAKGQALNFLSHLFNEVYAT